MSNQEKIQHFGVWIIKSSKNKMSRENYAIIDKKSSTWSPKIGKLRQSYYKTIEERKKDYDDEECKIYSDSFCIEWQKKCLLNFDMNLAFFDQIPRKSFEDALRQLIMSNKRIKQIFDLNDYKEICGIYVLVLDEYKQVYIGQAQDIKKRIMQHWSKKKPFDRLIFGGVNNSVLSIDSFGALDTTRIFILETESLDSSEKFAVRKMPAHFRLNRIGGGIPTNKIDILEALGEWNLRDLK